MSFHRNMKRGFEVRRASLEPPEGAQRDGLMGEQDPDDDDHHGQAYQDFHYSLSIEHFKGSSGL